jgi:hypothetical protein
MIRAGCKEIRSFLPMGFFLMIAACGGDGGGGLTGRDRPVAMQWGN